MYRIEETTVTSYGTERVVHRIVRTDGTPASYGPGEDRRIVDADFHSRDRAEIYRKFFEHTPPATA